MDKMDEKIENFNRVLDPMNKSHVDKLQLKDTIFEINLLGWI